MADFEWYRSFIHIYKNHSVSEAARIRSMTQPAMSQHLAALEAEVGGALFNRTSRKMVPTERGKQLYSQLAPLVEALEEATLGFKFASVPALSVIRIGSAHEFYSEHILPKLRQFNTGSITRFGTAESLLEVLKEDQLDLVVTSKKLPIQGVEYAKLMEEQFVIVAPRSYEVPPMENLKRKEQWLTSQRWISYGLELPMIRRIWREHFKQRPLIQPAHVIPNLHMMHRAITNGEGIGVLPTYILDKSAQTDQTKVLFEELKVSNELFFAYKSKHNHLNQLREIMSIIQERE
ncbi:LysR family transcriptional regulator [Cohnella sp. AR92]|uniref:LysR family transcriptional regulator n=1 Tax=Cohnella sp. AR92 TaxID=648716 RepID=UPI000F8D2D32|nr:LysR family transcriptional regulator [Cohnella sp. AR92]RUS45674.1 LysR family transcriptional regulator [Cohnella sp. AR92]